MKIEELIEIINEKPVDYAVLSCGKINTGIKNLKKVVVISDAEKTTLLIIGKNEQTINIVINNDDNILYAFKSSVEKKEYAHVIVIEDKTSSMFNIELEIAVKV